MLNFIPKYFPNPLGKQPVAPATFALVCRKWKDIIYNTRAFWAMVYINSDDFFKDINSQKSPEVRPHSMLRLEHARWRAQMANGAPMSLYLSQLPTFYIDPTPIHNILQVAPNLQKLRVNNYPGHIRVGALFFSKAWPELINLREVTYLVRFDTLVEVDLSLHFQGMPHLTRLWINESKISLPFCMGSPLFPALKHLRLQGQSARDHERETSTPAFYFLSHCPRIEELYLIQAQGAIMRYVPNQNDRLPIRLASLRKISTGSMSVMAPFIDGRIITPALKVFGSLQGLRLYRQETLGFFEANAGSLTTLYLFDTGPSNHQVMLVPLVHLTFLKLLADRDVGAYLEALYTPINRTLTMCLPSLLTFHLKLKGTCLSPEDFISFVNARCIPVYNERITMMGCHALNRFIVEPGSTLVDDLKVTKEWKAASMLEGDPATFELHWEA